jgi:hypothetical protein
VGEIPSVTTVASSEGTFSCIDLSLVEGENQIKIKGVDTSNQEIEETYTTTVDTAPPILKVSPVPEVSIEELLNVNGTVTDPSGVTLEFRKTTDDLTPPGKVQNITVTTEQNGIKLEWQKVNVSDLLDYVIYRDEIGPIAISATETYTDITVGTNSTYTYSVAARDESLNIGEQSSQIQVTVENITKEATTASTFNLNTPVHILEEVASNFSQQVKLVHGKNLIKVTAVDKANNTAEVDLEVYYDGGAPQITILDPQDSRTFYSNYADHASIKGKVDKANVTLQLFIDGWKSPNEAKTDANGNFIFNDVNLLDSRAKLEKAQAITAESTGIETMEGSEFQQQFEKDFESQSIALTISATDLAKRTTNATVNIIVKSCWSQDFDFDINVLEEYRMPPVLSSENIEEGTALISFYINYSYQGQEGELITQAIPTIVPITDDEYLMSRPGYSTAMRLIEGAGQNIYPNPSFDVLYARFDLNAMKNLTHFYRPKNASNDFSLGNNSNNFIDEPVESINELTGTTQLIFPFEIIINYDIQKPGTLNVLGTANTEHRMQRRCVELAYSVDTGKVDPRDVLPDWLLYNGVDVLNKTREILDTTLEYMKPILEYATWICIGGFGLRLLFRIIRKFTCHYKLKVIKPGKADKIENVISASVEGKAEDALKQTPCDTYGATPIEGKKGENCEQGDYQCYYNQRLKMSGGDWKQILSNGIFDSLGVNYVKLDERYIADEELKTCFTGCYNTWKTEEFFYKTMRFFCDRVFCHEAPAKWTKYEDEWEAYNLELLEDPSRSQCSATGTASKNEWDGSQSQLLRRHTGKPYYTGGKTYDIFVMQRGSDSVPYFADTFTSMGSSAALKKMPPSELTNHGFKETDSYNTLPNDLFGVRQTDNTIATSSPSSCSVVCQSEYNKNKLTKLSEALVQDFSKDDAAYKINSPDEVKAYDCVEKWRCEQTISVIEAKNGARIPYVTIEKEYKGDNFELKVGDKYGTCADCKDFKSLEQCSTALSYAAGKNVLKNAKCSFGRAGGFTSYKDQPPTSMFQQTGDQESDCSMKLRPTGNQGLKQCCCYNGAVKDVPFNVYPYPSATTKNDVFVCDEGKLKETKSISERMEVVRAKDICWSYRYDEVGFIAVAQDLRIPNSDNPYLEKNGKKTKIKDIKKEDLTTINKDQEEENKGIALPLGYVNQYWLDRYYPSRDWNACWGLNPILDFGKVRRATLDPARNTVDAFVCLCIGQIYNRIKMLRNIVTRIMACLLTVRETGAGDSGACKELFSQYICDLFFELISLLINKCSVWGQGISSNPLGELVSVGFDSVFGTLAESSTILEKDYGGAVAESIFPGGPEAISRNICLAIFGFPVDWGFDNWMGAATTMPYQTNVYSFLPTFEIMTVDPNSNTATARVNANWEIFPGCDFTNYKVELVCIGESDLQKPGVDCTDNKIGKLHIESTIGITGLATETGEYGSACACADKGLVNSLPYAIAAGKALKQDEVESGHVDLVKNVAIKPDHLKITLIPNSYTLDGRKIDTSDCFPAGVEGQYYFPIKDDTKYDLFSCSLSEMGTLNCGPGGVWGGEEGLAFIESVEPKDNEYIYTGNKLVVEPRIWNSGSLQCLRISVEAQGSPATWFNNGRSFGKIQSVKWQGYQSQELMLSNEELYFTSQYGGGNTGERQLPISFKMYIQQSSPLSSTLPEHTDTFLNKVTQTQPPVHDQTIKFYLFDKVGDTDNVFEYYSYNSNGAELKKVESSVNLEQGDCVVNARLSEITKGPFKCATTGNTIDSNNGKVRMCAEGTIQCVSESSKASLEESVKVTLELLHIKESSALYNTPFECTEMNVDVNAPITTNNYQNPVILNYKLIKGGAQEGACKGGAADYQSQFCYCDNDECGTPKFGYYCYAANSDAPRKCQFTAGTAGDCGTGEVQETCRCIKTGGPSENVSVCSPGYFCDQTDGTCSNINTKASAECIIEATETTEKSTKPTGTNCFGSTVKTKGCNNNGECIDWCQICADVKNNQYELKENIEKCAKATPNVKCTKMPDYETTLKDKSDRKKISSLTHGLCTGDSGLICYESCGENNADYCSNTEIEGFHNNGPGTCSQGLSCYSSIKEWASCGTGNTCPNGFACLNYGSAKKCVKPCSKNSECAGERNACIEPAGERSWTTSSSKSYCHKCPPGSELKGPNEKGCGAPSGNACSSSNLCSAGSICVQHTTNSLFKGNGNKCTTTCTTNKNCQEIVPATEKDKAACISLKEESNSVYPDTKKASTSACGVCPDKTKPLSDKGCTPDCGKAGIIENDFYSYFAGTNFCVCKEGTAYNADEKTCKCTESQKTWNNAEQKCLATGESATGGCTDQTKGLDNGNCVDCTGGKQFVHSINHECITCDEGEIQNDDKTECICAMNGYGIYDEACVMCSDDLTNGKVKELTNSDNQCVCKEGYAFEDESKDDCIKCEVKTGGEKYVKNQVCKTCPEKQGLMSGTTCNFCQNIEGFELDDYIDECKKKNLCVFGYSYPKEQDHPGNPTYMTKFIREDGGHWSDSEPKENTVIKELDFDSQNPEWNLIAEWEALESKNAIEKILDSIPQVYFIKKPETKFTKSTSKSNECATNYIYEYCYGEEITTPLENC